MSLKLFSLHEEKGPELGTVAARIFESPDSLLFLNDQLEDYRKKEILNQLSEYVKSSSCLTEPSFLIPTSGTTSTKLKIVVLKKSNFLNAARRANKFLNSSLQENWMMSLPAHHVAGLSILARAYLFKNHVYYWAKWQPEEFIQRINEWQISFCSLVPTQVFDLTSKKISAPQILKKVLVGGSTLPESIFQEMSSKGWPLVKTYGMTETSAFISFSDDAKADYRPLPGVKIKLTSDNYIAIECDSLFEGYIEQNETWRYRPKTVTNNGFWITEDQGQISDSEIGSFKVLGREKSMIKVMGELVNTQLLNSRLSEIASELNLNPQSVMIHFLPDLRNENELLVIYEQLLEDSLIKSMIEKFNSAVLPFERITSKVSISKIPRTELGKIKTAEVNSKEYRSYFSENRKPIFYLS